MEEYINEAIEVSDDDFLGEAYDKEWALKDQGHREGLRENGEKIVKHMSKKYGVNTIIEMTGLSREEVEEYAGEDLREEDFLEEIKEDKNETKKEIVKKMLEEKVDISLIQKSNWNVKRRNFKYAMLIMLIVFINSDVIEEIAIEKTMWQFLNFSYSYI